MKKNPLKLKAVKVKSIHRYQAGTGPKRVQETDPTTVTIATTTHMI